MALIKCNECGKEMSDKANTCPNCSYRVPPQKMTKLDKIFVPIITITIFLGIMGLSFSPEFVSVTRPNMKEYTTYNKNGLIGYDTEGNEIRGTTSHKHYNLGEAKKDYSKVIVVATLSIAIPTSSIITYIKLKKKEKKRLLAK